MPLVPQASNGGRKFVEPDVHPIDQKLRQLLPVLLHRRIPAAKFWIRGKFKDLLQGPLPRVIGGESLAKDSFNTILILSFS
jgi:hypothetical protein